MEMKVWTIQTQEAWQRLKDTATLRISEEHIEPKELLPAYRWMAAQMKVRIGPPPAGVEYPIWVWYQYRDAAHPRPDLRHRAHLPPGTAGVRLECEVAEESVLLSDFDLWHSVLNERYLARSDAE